MNDNIGSTLTVPAPRAPGITLLCVAFPTSDPKNPINWELPSRLHVVETVFAMMVHTVMTRARDWLTLIEHKRGILNDAVTREVMRVSGYAE